MIDRQAERLSRLVEDLLDLFRIAQGKMQFLPVRVSAAAAAEAAVEAVRDRAAKRGLTVEIQRPDEPALVRADPVRLDQILANLLDNALKYTPRGGVRVAVETDAAQAVVRVRDTGVGIPAAALGKVFDLYAQEERSRGHAQGGLGIGLALVKQLVSLHGGSVSATQ